MIFVILSKPKTHHQKPRTTYMKRFIILFLLLPFSVFGQFTSGKMPVLSNEERDKITELYDGLILFNSTTNCINYYGGGMWRAICGQCVTPPTSPVVTEVKPFYNSVTIKIKQDGYKHQVALLPSFMLIPDTSSKVVIARTEDSESAQQIMLINVSDCGSSQPLLVENAQFSENDPCGKVAKIIDSRDGNEYRVYSVGNQCWMTTNLLYGTADNKEIFLETDGYHKLYNWNFAKVTQDPKTKMFQSSPYTGEKNVCPVGWHVPTEQDIDELTSFYRDYGSPSLLRNIFKSEENIHFYNIPEKKHEPLDERLMFWGASTSPYDDGKIVLLIVGNEITKYFVVPQAGLPIRCVKDK